MLSVVCRKANPDSHREHGELRLIINQDSVLRPIILIDQPKDLKGFFKPVRSCRSQSDGRGYDRERTDSTSIP